MQEFTEVDDLEDLVECGEHCQFTEPKLYQESCQGGKQHFSCLEGQKKAQPCLGGNWSSVTCLPCEDGSFQDKPNNCTECRPCSKCPEGHLVSQPCTPERDTECVPELASTTPDARLRQGSVSTRSPASRMTTPDGELVTTVTTPAPLTSTTPAKTILPDLQQQIVTTESVPTNRTVSCACQRCLSALELFLIVLLLVSLICGLVIPTIWKQIKRIFKGGNKPGGSAPI
ncbi:uncharacterized protein [Diadema setosum]|uniref:uncharacterized protein n=1 Tax=Diadema setosum TaxID=31175 RepID=UPI003B3B3316